jgi:hypothetical protein
MREQWRDVMKKLICILCVFIVGFASTAAYSKLYESSEHLFSVEIPDGWRKVDTNKYFMITKDGPFQQYAMIQRRPIDHPFKSTKKILNKRMLPHEAARTVVDEINSDPKILNFSIIENSPATINGHEGFKVLFSYKDAAGKAFKMVYYGFINGDSFYNLRYNAALKDYFERDIATFEKMLGSFRLVNNKAS